MAGNQSAAPQNGKFEAGAFVGSLLLLQVLQHSLCDLS